MTIDRPDFKKMRPNIKATIRQTRSDSIFLDIPKLTTARLRFAPKEGELAVLVRNHFGFKKEDGAGMALACLRHHGTAETGDDCYICRLCEYLETADTKLERGLVKGRKNVTPGKNFYYQVWVREDDVEVVYTGPRLLRVPKSGAEAIAKVFADLDRQGLALPSDADEGQDLFVTNNGKLPLYYEAKETGEQSNLDEVIPGWTKRFIRSVYDALKLGVYTPYEQYEIAKRSYPEEIDWEKAEASIGIPEKG